MAKSKALQAIVEIAGSISPTLGNSVKSATSALEKLNLKAIAIGAAVGGAAIATGKAVAKAGEYLFQLGESFDTAQDAIRVGTGATGDDLTALMDTAKEVYSSIPTTMEEAAQAIADYNTRLGVTGDTLEELSKQAISVSDIMGEDLDAVIESSSQAMQNWNIDESHMSEAMDYMFKVAQSTGVSFTELSTQMQTYGAQLQEVGYSFRDASTLLGQVQKEGLDSATVITALKTAARQAADDGFNDLNDGIGTYISEIQNATDDTEAYSLATKYFGSKAAATMTQAIKKGTLSVESLSQSLTESDESILGCAEDTYSFSEQLQMMKAKLEVALAPMAETIFSSISDMMPTLIGMLETFLPVISSVVEQSLPFVEQFLNGIAEFLPVIIPMIMDLAEQLMPIFLNLIETLLPPLLDLITQLIPPLMEIMQAILPPIVDIITQILPIITEIAAAILPVLVDIIASLMPVIKPLLDILVNLFKSVIMPILEPLLKLAETVLPVIVSLLKLIAPILEPINKILGPIAEVIGVIVGAIAKVVEWVANGLGWLVDLFFGDGGDTSKANDIAKYAAGGFTHGPSIAGEEGTEAVISFDPAYRERNIRILEQAALMLGMSGIGDNGSVISESLSVPEEYSSLEPSFTGGNTGIIEQATFMLKMSGIAESSTAIGESLSVPEEDSYTAQAGKLLSIPDFSLSEISGSGGVTYVYDFSGFTWSPTITNEGGGSADDFMERLEQHESEFFDWLMAFMKAREVCNFG